MDAAAPICSPINPPLRSAPIRPAQSTRGTGRTTGRALFSCLVSSSGLPTPSIMLDRGDGGDFILRPVAFDCLNCLPAILRLSGNTRAGYAGRHVVGSRSGLIVSPPASYPLLFRILSPVSRPVAPCRLIPCPSNPVSLRSVLSAKSP